MPSTSVRVWRCAPRMRCRRIHSPVLVWHRPRRTLDIPYSSLAPTTRETLWPRVRKGGQRSALVAASYACGPPTSAASQTPPSTRSPASGFRRVRWVSSSWRGRRGCRRTVVADSHVESGQWNPGSGDGPPLMSLDRVSGASLTAGVQESEVVLRRCVALGCYAWWPARSNLTARRAEADPVAAPDVAEDTRLPPRNLSGYRALRRSSSTLANAGITRAGRRGGVGGRPIRRVEVE
jgi:hypothetical protein